MTSFFPDLNVWLALTVIGHRHNQDAERWLNRLRGGLIFSWYTQLGFLRLLTNRSIMQDETLTTRQAWAALDRWFADPRVSFHPEPRHLDRALRDVTGVFPEREASKWIGDCYLLAWARQADAVLVTFDRRLFDLAKEQSISAILPV